MKCTIYETTDSQNWNVLSDGAERTELCSDCSGASLAWMIKVRCGHMHKSVAEVVEILKHDIRQNLQRA